MSRKVKGNIVVSNGKDPKWVPSGSDGVICRESVCAMARGMFEVDHIYRFYLHRPPRETELFSMVRKVLSEVSAGQAGGETNYTSIVKGVS